MIELLNSRKMIIVVIGLVLMCILILILEGILTENELRPSPQRENDNRIDKSLMKLMNDSEQYCWMFENYSFQGDCVACSDFERAIKKPSACIKYGYKQLINCEKTGKVYISCSSANSHHFWSFQLICILLFLGSSYCAKLRSQQLDSKMADRLKRQLEAGV